MVQLSKRLQAVADMVTKGYRVADIGCDHGYIAIYLIESDKSPIVIAMDVNRGPLEQARENVIRSGCEDRIRLRLSDGAKELQQQEVDSMICAGMGGRLTIRIMNESIQKIYLMKEIILQPQSEIHLVRRFLKEMNIKILSETMIYEDGKYYPIIKAVPVHRTLLAECHDQKEALLFEQYGEHLLKDKNQILLKYLQWKENEIETITQQILNHGSSERIRNARLEALSFEKEQVQNALQYFKGD